MTHIVLLVQCLGLNLSAPLSWPTWVLVICSMLKRRESRRAADYRLVALLQLLSTGLLAAQMQGLLASGLQLITVILAVSGLLAHELGGVVSLAALLRRSLQLLLAALPLALVLFLFVPRVAPLWSTDLGPRGGAVSGLSPEMDPLSIGQLARSDAPAARVTLDEGERLNSNSYWRVLVHEQFDGRSWRHEDPPLPPRSGRGGPRSAGPSQWWRVEPSAIRMVPWDGAAQPASTDQWVSSEGELLMASSPRRPRSYRLQQGVSSMGWQQQLPQPRERALPPDQLPRLQALGRTWRDLPKNVDRLSAAEAWFRSQPFRYSLEPGSFVDLDAFLFDQQVGFCGHYAGALAALMRAADVPSRVVSGYQGGRLVRPLGGSPYLDLRQSDAHAWVEVWLTGQGWKRVDPTRWAGSGQPADQSIDAVVTSQSGPVPWWRWLQWQWWGLDLAWTRWWLGFDQATQAAWLQALFGEQLRWAGLVAVVLAAIAVGFGLMLSRGGWPGFHRDPLQRSLRLLKRLGVKAMPGESFPALCRRAGGLRPELALEFQTMAEAQQQLDHALLSRRQRQHQRKLWRQSRTRLMVSASRSGRSTRS